MRFENPQSSPVAGYLQTIFSFNELSAVGKMSTS